MIACDCSLRALREKLGIESGTNPLQALNALIPDCYTSHYINQTPINTPNSLDAEILSFFPRSTPLSLSPTLLSDLQHPSFTFLIHLRLSSLELTDPTPFLRLKFLQDLCVSNNRLTDVSFIFQLPYLRKFDASMNQISILPQHLPSQLFSLNLSFNRLTLPSDAAPPRFPDQLLMLKVAKNPRLACPPNFGKYLLILDVMGCKLASVSISDVLAKYPLLVKANLSGCGLQTVGESTPLFCPFLSELFLSGNDLQELSFARPLPSLSVLKVDCNYDLRWLNVGFCPKLKSLDISFTQVSALPNVDISRTSVVATDAPLVSTNTSLVTNPQVAFFWRRPDNSPLVREAERGLTEIQRMLALLEDLSGSCEHSGSRDLMGMLKRSWNVHILKISAVESYNRFVSEKVERKSAIPITHPVITAGKRILRFLRFLSLLKKRDDRREPLSQVPSLKIPPKTKLAVNEKSTASKPQPKPKSVASSSRSAPLKPLKPSKPLKLTAQESIAAYFNKLAANRNL